MYSLTALGGIAPLLLSFLGLGLPIAVPPAKEEPIMAHIAPDDCVLYATWAAVATPSGTSANQTEQLLAEPEVREFAAALQRNILAASLGAATQGGMPPAQAEKIGRAASVWIRTVLSKSGALYVSRLAPRGNGLDVQGALLIKADEAAAEMEQSLADLLASHGAPLAEATIGGRKFRRLELPGNPPVDVVWAADEGYLKLGLGAGAIEEMAGRIRAQKEPAWLTQLKANLPVERRSTITYFNVKRVLDAFVPLGGPEAEATATALGAKQIASWQSVSGLDQVGLLRRSLLAIDGQPRGLLSLVEEKGIAAADLKHIPAEALMAYAFVLDPRKVYEQGLEALAEIEPQAAKEVKMAVLQAQAETGVNIPETLAALGSHWSVHNSAADGGWLGTTLAIEVRNKAVLAEVENKLLARAQGGAIRGIGRVSQTQYAGQTISTLTPGPSLAILTPSWCVTDKHLIVALNPQAVKSALARQAGEKSLAEVPEVAARLGAGTAPLALSYTDTPAFFANTYALAQTMLPVVSQMAERSKIPFDLSAAQLPTQRTISKHLRPSVTTITRTPRGIESESRQTFPGLSVGAAGPVAVALLLPAVQAAREAARRTQSSNNIKQQMLALHNYHDTFGTFPPAYSQGNEGQKLLSWRVAILPFLEQQQLYAEFHLDEPWDSEHNKKLIERMPKVLRSPNSSAERGMTTYRGVGGEHGVLGPAMGDNKARGTRLAEIIDGTSNTITIVEASDSLATVWTQPDDWTPDEKEPLKGLLGMRPNGFLVGFADGSVRFISKNIDPEMLRRLFHRNDGQPVEIPDR